jgi:hypothetical protein
MLYGVIGGGVLLLVIIAVAAALMLSSGGGGLPTGLTYPFQNSDGEYIFVYNGKAEDSVEGTISSGDMSLDQKTYWFIVRDGNERILYVVSKGKLTEVDDEVYSVVISNNGKKIAYLKDQSGYEADLYVYDTASKKKQLVDNGAYTNKSMVFSPDGGTLAYAADYDSSDGTFVTKLSKGGNRGDKFGDNLTVFGVSNGGSYVYYDQDPDKSDGIFVRTSREDIKLFSERYASLRCFFNNTRTEILFSDSERTYVSVRGGDRISVCRDVARGILNDFGDVKTFKNRFLRCSGGVYYIGGKYEAQRATTDTSAQLANNGKALLYQVNSGRINRITNFKTLEGEQVADERDVYRYAASTNGKTVYYLNADEELYVVKGTGTPAKIADDVDRFVLSPKGDRVFFISDVSSRNDLGALYTSTAAAKKVKVKDSGEVYRYALTSTSDSVFFIKDPSGGYGQLWYSSGGAGFKKIADDISN